MSSDEGGAERGHARTTAPTQGALAVAPTQGALAVATNDKEGDGEEIDNYECQHHFVPLAFEGYGAWGESALRFFDEVCNAAEEKASADKYHWSAMEFGVHFQQRLGLTLALGQADLVVSAAEDRRANGKRKDRIRTAANDFHQDCCPPCASR